MENIIILVNYSFRNEKIVRKENAYFTLYWCVFFPYVSYIKKESSFSLYLNLYIFGNETLTMRTSILLANKMLPKSKYKLILNFNRQLYIMGIGAFLEYLIKVIFCLY